MEGELTKVRDEVEYVKRTMNERVQDEISKVENTVTAEVTSLKTEVTPEVIALKAGVAAKVTALEEEVQAQRNRMREANGGNNGTGSGDKVKPPMFDGKVPWSMYLRQIEAACEINYWSDKEKATALIVALRGDALNILQTIPANDQKNYSGDRHMQSAYQMQLRTTIQKNVETLQEFESEVVRLLLSYPNAPTEFLEQIGIEAFIRGIRDIDTQQALLLARHRTLAEALGHALEFEAAKQASRTNIRVE